MTALLIERNVLIIKEKEMTASKRNLENSAMRRAAREGNLDLVELCRERGATDFDGAMWRAAYRGHFDIAMLCWRWGATDFCRVLCDVVCVGNLSLRSFVRREERELLPVLPCRRPLEVMSRV